MKIQYAVKRNMRLNANNRVAFGLNQNIGVTFPTGRVVEVITP